jgi:hypothetical protein
MVKLESQKNWVKGGVGATLLETSLAKMSQEPITKEQGFVGEPG